MAESGIDTNDTGIIMTNPCDILNELDKYFTTIWPNLASKLHIDENINPFETSNAKHSDVTFPLSPVGEEIVHKQIDALNEKKNIYRPWRNTSLFVLSKLCQNSLFCHCLF